MPPKKGRPPRSPSPPPALISLSMSSDSDLSLEPMVLIPPDGGYGWVVVAACFFMNIICDGAIYTFGFFQKNLQVDFDKDAAAIALLASLCSGFYYVAAPLWSAMGNRWGFRTVGVVGSVAACMAFVACFFIVEYVGFMVVYGILLGAACGGVYISTMISVGFYFERWRGLATSLASCGSGLGVLVMPSCYKAMSAYSGYSWRWIMAFNACAFGVVLLPLALLLRPLQPVPLLRADRTVRFQEVKKPAKKPVRPGGRGKQAAAAAASSASSGLRQLQLHAASAISLSPSVFAPQFDAISMTSRAFPRSGPDARDMQSGSRPMYRDDIFYGAGASRLNSQMSTRIATLTEQAEQAVEQAGEREDEDDTLDLDLTVDELPLEEEAAAAAAPAADTRWTRCWSGVARCWACAARCRLCPHAVTSTLTALLHHSILTNTVFIVFAASQVLVMLGFFTPFLFSQDQAIEAGVSPDVAEWILPSLGMASAIGRGLSGIICEVPGVSALPLTCITLIIASVVVGITCVSASPAFQLFASAAFGFFMAPYMSMKSLILVDFLGIERLTNSFGLLLMFQGFAVMVGPPMNGWIYEKTKSYQYVYIISGSLLFIASILTLLMYPLSTYELRKEMKQASRRSS